MRVLNVSSLYPPNVVGGAELGLKVKLDALAAAGHEQHVVTLAPPEGAGEQPAQRNGAVTVHPVALANIYWPFRQPRPQRSVAERLLWHGIDTANEVMARRVEKIVRRVRPDIVMTANLQGFSTAVMPAVKRAGVPLVHVLHDYALLCPQTTLWRNGRGCGFHAARCSGCRLLTAPRRGHLKAVDGVIGVSRAVLALHREHGLFRDRPARIIHNALAPQFKIRTRPPARDPEHVFTFGYLGRVEPSKGIETLLRAMTELGRSGHRCRLLVAGRAEPDYLAELRRRWPLANVTFLGFVAPAEFLGRLDALVFPSEWLEALGNGVFEAFSQGVPVIGARTGGIPESIDEGTNGLTFEAGNVTELAACMKRLREDRAFGLSMASAALRKARQYLAPVRAAEYVAFLEQILTAHKSGKAA